MFGNFNPMEMVFGMWMMQMCAGMMQPMCNATMQPMQPVQQLPQQTQTIRVEVEPVYPRRNGKKNNQNQQQPAPQQQQTP